MRKDISYLSNAVGSDILANVEYETAEECSNACANELGDVKGCRKFTWKNGDDKRCWLFTTENLVGSYQYGSYSGLPRRSGNKNT